MVNSNEPPVVNIFQNLSSISINSVSIDANLSSFLGGQPNVELRYDDNASFNQIRNAPYTPYEVGPKLALWLDANDTATIINDDGNVSEWRDKSGNNLHLTQDTNASKPFTGGHTQNGSNVVSFDGDDFLQRGFS